VTVIISGGTSGDLNPGFLGAGAPVATGVAVVRKTSITSNLGDVISAQVTEDWDQISAECRAVLPEPNGSIGNGMQVSMGAGNNVQRFNGTLLEYDTTLFPHAVTALGKGPLYALDEYENGTESTITGIDSHPGLFLNDLVGFGGGATLQQIVLAVLNTVGITNYSLSNFDDPPHLYGAVAPEEFTWGTHQSASAYLHSILEASDGYRLFESNGVVYLKQITVLPNNDPLNRAGIAFTLGQDIMPETTASTSMIGQRGAVLVEGYDPGDGGGPYTSGTIGSTSPSVFRISSPKIESDAYASQIANFWLPQVNRNQRLVRLQTPRDDLLGPGMTVFIDAAKGLGVNETMWVKSVTAELDDRGQFTQHLVCVAGA
jgi:hypothetical protein